MKQRAFLISLSFIGILFLLFIVHETRQIHDGQILSLKYSSSKITLLLEGFQEPLIIFSNAPLGLKKGDQVEFIGSKENYRGDNQFIVEKIWRISPTLL